MDDVISFALAFLTMLFGLLWLISLAGEVSQKIADRYLQKRKDLS